MYPAGENAGHRTEFPIFRSAKEFEARYSRKVKGPRKLAVEILKQIRPYKGGNHALWALHRLDIIDKHHVLVPVGASYLSVTTKLMGFERMAETETDPDLLRLFANTPPVFLQLRPAKGPDTYPLKDGTVLYGVNAGVDPRDVDMNPQFAFTIAFGKGEPVEGEPIVPTLRQFADLVEGIVEQFARLL